MNFVGEKIRALRAAPEASCQNIAVFRTNSMRHLTNYVRESQLNKIFICFPDPHFKTHNHRRRIVNLGFLSEYAYVLRSGGKIYCITDVKELHEWHVKHLEAHSLFRAIPEEEFRQDPCFLAIWNKTEEGIKVERNEGDKFACVYECVK